MRPLLLLLALAACTADAPEPAPQPMAANTTTQAQTLAPEADWTREPVALDGATRDVTVTSVEVEGREGYDRVLFAFKGGHPGVRVEVVPSMLAGCASGEPFAVEVAPVVSVSLTGARGHSDTGEATIRHERAAHDLPTLGETIPTCDFEGRVEWALVLTAPEAYRVTRLNNPDRLAVDLRHPTAD